MLHNGTETQKGQMTEREHLSQHYNYIIDVA